MYLIMFSGLHIANLHNSLTISSITDGWNALTNFVNVPKSAFLCMTWSMVMIGTMI